MLSLKNNRKGSIPVTIFVIVVLVLIITTLGAFSIGTFLDKGSISEGYEKVQEYNSNVAEAGFRGEQYSEAVRLSEKNYWIFGKEVLKVSVSRIP